MFIVFPIVFITVITIIITNVIKQHRSQNTTSTDTISQNIKNELEQTKPIKTCSYCGTKIDGDIKRCPNCGATKFK